MYRGIIECGWKTGIHDVRTCHYQHPWLVVYRKTGEVVGCYCAKKRGGLLPGFAKDTQPQMSGKGNYRDGRVLKYLK